MASDPVRGSETLTSSNTPYNTFRFVIDNAIRDKVNTSELVQVTAADAQGPDTSPGYVRVTPLVAQTDGVGNALPVTEWPSIPQARMQAGVAGIVLPAQPGDKGVAVIQKRDSSGVQPGKTEASTPGSYREFDPVDSVFFNGVQGLPLEVWLSLDPVSGNIELSTKAASVKIMCRESGDIDISTGSGNVNIMATDRVNIKAPNIVLDGNVTITGNATGQNGGAASFGNGIRVNNGIVNTGGTIRSGNVTLDTHRHPGDSGGTTGGPIGG